MTTRSKMPSDFFAWMFCNDLSAETEWITLTPLLHYVYRPQGSPHSWDVCYKTQLYNEISCLYNSTFIFLQGVFGVCKYTHPSRWWEFYSNIHLKVLDLGNENYTVLNIEPIVFWNFVLCIYASDTNLLNWLTVRFQRGWKFQVKLGVGGGYEAAPM